MQKITNKTHFEGYVFSHTLEHRVTGPESKSPNTPYIRGRLNVATDPEGMNVVMINFSYIVEKTKAGKENPTYKTLAAIIDAEDRTFEKCGKEAMLVKVDSAIGTNDFYNAEGELITAKQNDRGFVHIVNQVDWDNSNSFETDMLITDTILTEESDENDPAYLTLSGATFDFAGKLIPVSFIVRDPSGIKYFESLDASGANPVFLKVWGTVISTTERIQTFEKSAFGEDAVKFSTRSFKEWSITGAASTPYDFGDPAVLTAEEVSAAVAARETYLVGVKEQHDAYMAKKASAKPETGFAAPSASQVSVAANTNFKF